MRLVNQRSLKDKTCLPNTSFTLLVQEVSSQRSFRAVTLLAWTWWKNTNSKPLLSAAFQQEYMATQTTRLQKWLSTQWLIGWKATQMFWIGWFSALFCHWTWNCTLSWLLSTTTRLKMSNLLKFKQLLLKKNSCSYLETIKMKKNILTFFDIFLFFTKTISLLFD